MAPSAVAAELGEPAGEPKCGVRKGRTSLEARITSVPYGLDKLLQPMTLPPASPLASPLKAAYKQPAWNLRTNPKAMGIANPIRELIEKMGAPNPDKPVIALSQGDPTVFGTLPVNQRAVDAVAGVATSSQGNGYSHSSGMEECRQAVADHHSTPLSRVPAHHVFMTSGCSQALEKCMAALAFNGGNILLPKPGFPLYQALAEFHGLEPRFYQLLEDRGWEADLHHLTSLADHNTAAVLVCNPGNPTGQNYTEAHLRALVATADALRIPIVADEVYDGMVFHGETFTPIAAVSTSVPVLSVGALSKKCLVPGWRCGWVVAHDRHSLLADANVLEALAKLQMLTLGPCGIVQTAMPAILRSLDDAWMGSVMATLEDSASVVLAGLAGVRGLQITSRPQGALYVMVKVRLDQLPSVTDDVAFATALMAQESVAVLPGTLFHAPGMFRICFAAPPPILKEACARIAALCQRLAIPQPGTPSA